MKYPENVSFLRHIVLLYALVAFALPAHAQLIRGYGVKAGLAYSKVHSPDINSGGGDPIYFDTKRHTGFATFVFVEWLEKPPLSIVTEAGYVQRGFALEFEMRDAQNNPMGTFRFYDRFDYLYLTALAKLRRPIGALTPYLLGGPHFGFFLGGDPGEEGTFASSYSSTAFGGTFGIGTEVSGCSPIMLFIEARYSVDFTNSLPDAPRDAYNNGFDVLIGLRL